MPMNEALEIFAAILIVTFFLFFFSLGYILYLKNSTKFYKKYYQDSKIKEKDVSKKRTNSKK